MSLDALLAAHRASSAPARRLTAAVTGQEPPAAVAAGPLPPDPAPVVRPEAFLRRRVRSPEDNLRMIARTAATLRRREFVAVRVARDTGMTWAQIADALGVTPQAARQRFGHRV